MASFTQIAIVSRKIIRYGIYSIIAIMLLRVAWFTGKAIYRTAFPKPPPPPTVSFGPLPKIEFPQRDNIPDYSIKIETAEGTLPKFTDQLRIYFMPKISPRLLTLDAAKEKVAKLGFSPSATPKSQTVYTFQHPREPSTLEINIVTQAFSISYNLSANPELVSGIPPLPENAISFTRGLLKGADFLPEDLSGRATHEFLKIEGQSLVSSISLSESNLIKVNLFRKNINELPSVTADPKESNVWFIIGPENKIVAAEYHHFPVDEEQFATYPIKTAQKALENLQNKKAYIANFGVNQEGGEIIVRDIYLAYYDSGTQEEFYQPIIVFEGDGNFRAYVPAVSDEYYGVE